MLLAMSLTVSFFKKEKNQHALFACESFHPDLSLFLIQANPPVLISPTVIQSQ